MYLTRSERVLCLLCLILTLILTITFGYFLIAENEGRRGHDPWGLVCVGVLLLITGTPGTLYLVYTFSEASKLDPQPDTLRNTLQMTTVAERKGVQWALIAFPDRVHVPCQIALTVFLQNAHRRKRRVRVSVSGAVKPLADAVSVVELEGGEAGVLKIPVLADGLLPEKSCLARVDVAVEAPDGVGVRLIRDSGTNPRRDWASRNLTIEIAGRHAGPPLNPEIPRLSGYSPIRKLGDPRADLEPVRLLDSLRGEPT